MEGSMVNEMELAERFARFGRRRGKLLLRLFLSLSPSPAVEAE